MEIINRHSHLGSLNDPSNYSSITQTDHASTVSRSSGAAAAPHTPNPAAVSRHELPSPPTELPSPDLSRPDSPPLGRDYDDDVVVSQPVSPQHTGQPQQQIAGGQQQQTAGGQTGGENGGRQLGSGVSEVSERDRAHLRQISDATVSSVGTQGGGDRVLPEAGGQAAGAGPSTTSPLRRSIFRESREDMGGGKGT